MQGFDNQSILEFSPFCLHAYSFTDLCSGLMGSDYTSAHGGFRPRLNVTTSVAYVTSKPTLPHTP